jgi:dTDP-4-dehydrorhamnose 3,5-epimerase
MTEDVSKLTQGSKIEGVYVQPLRKICDERGMIMHMLRCDSPIFTKFGEVYFSQSMPGAIKGWHIHREQTQHYCVVQGMIKLVLCDLREDSPSKGVIEEHFLGEDNYSLIRIPVGVANGYKTYGTKPALTCNCSDLPHGAPEMDRIDPFSDEIDYCWDLKHM